MNLVNTNNYRSELKKTTIKQLNVLIHEVTLKEILDMKQPNIIKYLAKRLGVSESTVHNYLFELKYGTKKYRFLSKTDTEEE